MKIHTKNKLLFGGILLFGILSYQFAFKKTIEQYKATINLKAKINNYLYTESYPLLLKQEKELDEILTQRKLSTKKSYTNNLFEKLTLNASKNQVDIKSFNEPYVYAYNNKSNIYTYEITLTGSFKNMLSCIYALENTNLGTVISQNYTKQKNYKNNRSYLTCTFLLQTIH